MTKSRIARFAGVAAGVALSLSLAPVAGAQTVTIAQLQAQIAALMAQLQALQGGSSASASVTFTRSLTVGSSGSDVSALQQGLIAGGYLKIAAPTGYFGSLTKAAVAAWQAAHGVSPAVGYFGPISQAAWAASMGGSTGGTTTGGTVSTGTSGGISTPGKEGILTITNGPLSNTVANVGATMVPLITVRAQAQNSDIDVQRVTLDLGTNTNIFNKIYNKVYLVDGATGNVLASQNLNSSTVIQSGSDYITTITGFHFIVPAGSIKDIQVKADLYSSIDSVYISGGASAVNTTIMVPVNGVRGVDGAGVDQFGPSSSFSQAITINRSLVDNASAAMALSASSPLANSTAVTDTVNGQLLQVPLFAFNVTATNDTLHLHQVIVKVTGVPSGSNSATATAAYLYNGSTQVASASINSSTGYATFSNITDGTAGASIPAGTSVPFTVKVDVTGVTAGSIALTGTASSTGQTIYNSQDSTVTVTGSATGNTQTVLGKGPAVSLLSSGINATNVTNQSGNSTSTITATFNVQAQAVGGDVMFGTQASTSPMFVFDILKNGVSTGTVLNASSSAFQIPANVVNNGSNTFTLGQNQTVTIPVTFTFEDRLLTGATTGLGSGQYSVNLKQVNYVTTNGAASLTFMNGQTAWTTNTVTGLQ